MNIKKFILEKSNTQKSNTRKSNTKKRSKKSPIFIALMFLALICPKAWGYAEKDLPPSFSEELFSSDTLSSDQTFFLSRGVLTDENGVAICQVNLVENPEFLPQFAEPGSSNALKPLDLPDCEEQSLDIVAQYAEQAWIKRDVAIVPWVAGAFVGGCISGLVLTREIFPDHPDEHETEDIVSSTIAGGLLGVILGGPPFLSSSSFPWLHMWMGAMGGLVCSAAAHMIIYE